MFTLRFFWHFVNEALFHKRTATFVLSFLWYRLSAVKSYDVRMTKKDLFWAKTNFAQNFKRSQSWLTSWQKHNLKHGYGVDKRPAFKGCWRAGKAEWNIIGLCQRSFESRRKWSRVFGELSFMYFSRTHVVHL